MTLEFISLGRYSFSEALQKQQELKSRRQHGEISDIVLTVEHPRVITKGRRPADGDFLIPPEELERRGYAVAEAGRGGRLTYHGPGQLVAYFIVSLRERRLSVPAFVRQVEESVIRTVRAYGIVAERREGCPGVWIEGRKIASVGLAVDRGVSMHGIALNVNPKLSDFDVIVPCGITDCRMTSLEQELGAAPAWTEVERVFQEEVRKVFSLNSELDNGPIGIH